MRKILSQDHNRIANTHPESLLYTEDTLKTCKIMRFELLLVSRGYVARLARYVFYISSSFSRLFLTVRSCLNTNSAEVKKKIGP